MAEKPRIKAPASVAKGQIFEIKTLLNHPMESGLRKDESGQIVPRKIINRFVCKANGKDVFAIDLNTSVSPNPFITFSLRLEETSKLELSWRDDDGTVTSETITVEVK